MGIVGNVGSHWFQIKHSHDRICSLHHSEMSLHKRKVSKRWAYITELQSIDLGLHDIWCVSYAGELQLIRTCAVQPVVQDFLGFLGFNYIHRTFCQPANASQPLQVRLVHVLQINHGLPQCRDNSKCTELPQAQRFPQAPSPTVTHQQSALRLQETNPFLLTAFGCFAQQHK